MKAKLIDKTEAVHQTAHQNINDFKTLETRLKTRYNALTNPQKAALLDTITNWQAATAAQKSDALLGAVTLTIIVAGYIGRYVAPKLFE